MKNPRSRTTLASVLTIFVSLASTGFAPAWIGQWDFTDPASRLAPTAGSDAGSLAFLDGPGGATASQTSFGSTTDLGLPDIGGQLAQIMSFPASIYPRGYAMPTPPMANGPTGFESLVNDWTLILDIYYPSASANSWRAIIQTDEGFTPDADLFIDPEGGIGIEGQYSGQVLPDTWHRIGFVIDGTTGVIRKYIDGVEVGSQSSRALDDRWALTPAGAAPLLTDDDVDSAAGYVSSVQLRDHTLTPGQMQALGGPSADGIPLVISEIPAFILSRSPEIDQSNVGPMPLITVVLDQGDSIVDTANIVLLLNDSPLVRTVTTSGNEITVEASVPFLLPRLSVQTLTLLHSNSIAGDITNTWQFTVVDYKTVDLPAPIFLDDFDSVAPGSLPAGWTETNNSSQGGVIGQDLNRIDSDSYKGWTVSATTNIYTALREVNWVGTTYDLMLRDPGFTGLDELYGYRMTPYVVNGQLIDNGAKMVSGNLLAALSGWRSGTQIQHLQTRDYDLSGRSDVYLVYHALYMQNDESLGAVEYSIDGGNSWLPALITINEGDIVRNTDGSVDAVTTLTRAYGDVPAPDRSFPGSYGSHLKVPITQALAPFISGRIDDDWNESKRVEVIRLAQADHQASVRVRLTQVGTDSWHFMIDDFGFYEIGQPIPPAITLQPRGNYVSPGATVSLRAEAVGTPPLNYQWRKDSTAIPGAGNTNLLTLANLVGADAGAYDVVVSNAGGAVTSQVAQVIIFTGEIRQDLVLHLKFEADLSDSSGRNNNGTNIGSTAFAAGQIGQALTYSFAGDGSSFNYVTLGAPADLEFGTDTDFSVSFWAKFSAWTGDPPFISNKDWLSGDNQGWVIATAGDAHLRWNLAGPPGSRKDYDSPAGALGGGAWHHIAVVFHRDNTASTYLNGAQVNASSIAAGANDLSTSSGLALNIGQDGTGTYTDGGNVSITDGIIDDLGIWRRRLTPQEVTSIYTTGLLGNDLSTAGGVLIPLRILSIELSGTDLVLHWTGGTGPYTVQRKDALSDAQWADVLTTSENSAILPRIGNKGFLRITTP